MLAAVIALIVWGLGKKETGAGGQLLDDQAQETTVSPEEERAAKEDAERQAVVDSYANLGVVSVDGYLNMRGCQHRRGCHRQTAGRLRLRDRGHRHRRVVQSDFRRPGRLYKLRICADRRRGEGGG